MVSAAAAGVAKILSMKITFSSHRLSDWRATCLLDWLDSRDRDEVVLLPGHRRLASHEYGCTH